MLMDLLSTTLVRHILLRADRCDALPTVSTRSATYLLPQVLNANDLTAEAAIREHTRAFPRQVNSEWQEHLISLHPELERALAPAKKGVYEIKRPSPEKVIGVKLFDSLRKDAVHIRSLAAFRDAFATFGGSVLAGLDYSNIFIAGGSILATLTELDTGNFDDLLKGSDIDIFLYGLSGEEAHNKIISIANTIRSNVKDFDAKYLVERSAGTVSFLPHQGAVGRKIQVILRLARNPAEILAGFDFDEVCVGYDGTSVWLDLRAIRALRTGYTSTTGAISSSFAARVVKYATRGYGVKIECPNEDDRRLSLLKNTSDSLHYDIKKCYSDLPWYRKSNYSVLYTKAKQESGALWTQSFSAFATLAALWNVAYASGRITELMAAVGSGPSWYGGYDSADAMVTDFDREDWETVLNGLVPTLMRGRFSATHAIWKAQAAAGTADLLQKIVGFVVILPLQLRAFLQAAAQDVCGGRALRAMHGGEILEDSDGNRLEVCLWYVGGGNMWQPRSGLGGQVHQFLIRTAQLTAWTCWKMNGGAPWSKMHYGRALERAQRHTLTPGLSADEDFTEWFLP